MVLHEVTCYADSILSRVYVNTGDLVIITCTLVVTCMIVGRLECLYTPIMYIILGFAAATQVRKRSSLLQIYVVVGRERVARRFNKVVSNSGSGGFLGIIGEKPSVSKSDRLLVVIFRFFLN